nr:MAG TPA: transcription regulator [Caudoviricetes sp.]DAQ42887.1 MAG TPA: LacI family transcription regulator [Caudoviricetes sp.]
MYKNVEQVLRDVYKIQGVRMEPLNNTASVCAWCESKGVMGGGGELTQAETHANAAMIISRIERVLNRYELAAVECKYSSDLSGIIDLTAYIEEQNNGVNLLLCDAILSNLFIGYPKQTNIMDRYDVSKATVWRQQKKISQIIARLEETAQIKLYDEFKRCGIIS